MKIKICGLTRAADVDKAIALGADYVGFIAWPGSARFISPLDAAPLVASARGRARAVGVFVDPTVAELKLAYDAARFDLFQFHGNETPDIATLIEGVSFLRALRPKTEADLGNSMLEGWAGIPGFKGFLIDAAVAGQYGGTGQRSDWALAAKLVRRFPVFLSGGLSPANAGEAIQAVRPAGVDVSSGVESSPGTKDHQKMERFFDAVLKK